MPRIDPAQLLNCLHVLLSPAGGILSEEEVPRLASLMTKFSKKLVSKCVYVLILKNTDRKLLNLFMGCGGWTLIQLWLHDAMFVSNWDLVKELLELLILTPVDVERLKSNNIPKLVKSLSKRENLEGVCRLANQLVQQWLKIVKDETQSEQQRLAEAAAAAAAAIAESDSSTIENSNLVEPNQPEVVNENHELTESTISTKTFYKLSLKDSKQAHTKANLNQSYNEDADEVVEDENDEEHPKGDKKKSHDKSKHRSSSSSLKSSKSSHKDRHSSKSSSSSSKDKEKSKDKVRHHSSRDKDKDKDRDKHRSSSAASSNSSSTSKSNKSSSSSRKDKDRRESKDAKEKQTEKDQDTLHQIQPPSIHKLPKIPKKSSEDKNKEPKVESLKGGSISIEMRKTTEERPKTVKVYKSKMRSTGLEEEAKPAPPRTTKKPVIPPPVSAESTTPSVAPVKRPSPIRDLGSVPPEKKLRVDVPIERTGAIKLIPPKPKPAVLQESDMFMDALTAATTKKEPKKRKRRASASKDSGPTSPPQSPSASVGIKNITPPKFYQDTLQSDESKSQADVSIIEDNKENSSNGTSTQAMDESERASTPIEEDAGAGEVHLNASGLKSVLVYTRRKGPKKSIKWKADDELVDIRYFELDESERVNVTRGAFGDMAKMDVRSEREALQMSRKLQNEDTMENQTVWKVPTEIDLPPALVVPGCKSFERDIQFAREKSVLQALYFNKRMLPDSPGEPDAENYQIKDPILIPVEDTENPDHDFRNTPWPESKGSPPRVPPQNNPPTLFHKPTPPNFPIAPPVQQPNFQNVPPTMKPIMAPPLQFPNPQPQFVTPQQQNIPNVEWNTRNMPPNIMMQPNMPPPDLMNQAPPMNPMYMPTPPEHFNPGMSEAIHRFAGSYSQQGPPPGMFPPNNFNHNPNRGGHNRGRGGFGGFRRGGSAGGGGGWMRMNGPPQKNWNNHSRGHHRRGGGGGGNYNNRDYSSNAEMY